MYVRIAYNSFIFAVTRVEYFYLIDDLATYKDRKRRELSQTSSFYLGDRIDGTCIIFGAAKMIAFTFCFIIPSPSLQFQKYLLLKILIEEFTFDNYKVKIFFLQFSERICRYTFSWLHFIYYLTNSVASSPEHSKIHDNYKRECW